MGEIVEFEAQTQEGIRCDLSELFRGAVRVSLELMLEEEVKAMVGAGRYERVGSRRDSRNGTYMRRLLTSLGHLEVSVPRTRESGAPLDTLGRYARRTPEIDDMITEAYVSGVSTRKMAGVTKALMGEDVKRSTVSRITRRLAEQVEALAKAPIEGAYPYLYLDATFIDVRWARRVENVSALVAYAVGPDGKRYLLGVSLGAQESEESWSELLKQLVDRGLSEVLLVIADEHAGLAKAVRTWLPETKRQRCTVHMQRNVGAKVPQRLRKRVAGSVAKIFKADSRKAAELELEKFKTRWSKELPEAVTILERGFASATVFFDFPKEHWKRIRTTNSLERLHGEIKRRTKAVGSFPDA